MNQTIQSNQKIFIFFFTFAFLGLSNWSMQKQSIQSAPFAFTSVTKMVRLAHAEELLGDKTLKKVVPAEQLGAELDQHLLTIVQKSLRGSSKLYGPKLAMAIKAEAARYHFDPFFLAAVIAGESSFNPNIVGSFGEIGLMQIKPDTAKWIAKKMDLEYTGAQSLFDPVTNVRIGAAYFSYLRKKFNKRGALYVAAYNMGPTNVRRSLRRNYIPKDYPRHIMRKYMGFYRQIGKSKVNMAKLTSI